jgi:hypothetical protein
MIAIDGGTAIYACAEQNTVVEGRMTPYSEAKI